MRKKKEKQIEEKTSETVKTKETKNKMLEKISEETEKRKRKNPEITNPAKELSERYCDAANEKISKYGPPSCYRSEGKKSARWKKQSCWVKYSPGAYCTPSRSNWGITRG